MNTLITDAIRASASEANALRVALDERDQARADLAGALAAIADVKAERDGLRKENALLTHKIITCGVAASHPDADLSLRAKDYGGKWNSPQANEVRQLRFERDAAATQLVGAHATIVTLRSQRFAHVPLTGGRYTIVDEADYASVAAVLWRAVRQGGTWYAQRTFSRGKTPTSLHRLLTNCPADMVVDHINGDGLDNRRINLRVCTAKDNARNRLRGVVGKSGFRGVFQHPWGFEARIKANGQQMSLGTFKTGEDAARAYDIAAVRYFGAFAQPNFKFVLPDALDGLEGAASTCPKCKGACSLVYGRVTDRKRQCQRCYGKGTVIAPAAVTVPTKDGEK